MAIKQYLITILKDEERKNLLRILFESVHSGIIEKEIPIHYFMNLLYKKHNKNYKDYIGFKKTLRIRDEYMNPTGLNKELENKITFNEILLKNNINTPIILGSNDKKNFNLVKEKKVISSYSDFVNEIKVLVSKSSTNSVFLKPIAGIGGRNAFKVDSNKLADTEYIKKMFEIISEGKYIFQETILQHENVNKLYSNSINTIRIHTNYDKKSGKIEITSALMRIGSKGRVVDNGGMFIAIDIETWKLKGNAISFLKLGANTFEAHPDTEYVFDGFTIPYYEEIENNVLAAAKLFDTPFIGWDVGITPNGPIIIEGNSNPHLIMTQITCRGFKSHKVYKRIFAKYF